MRTPTDRSVYPPFARRINDEQRDRHHSLVDFGRVCFARLEIASECPRHAPSISPLPIASA
jgi:hypothetical protein